MTKRNKTDRMQNTLELSFIIIKFSFGKLKIVFLKVITTARKSPERLLVKHFLPVKQQNVTL